MVGPCGSHPLRDQHGTHSLRHEHPDCSPHPTHNIRAQGSLACTDKYERDTEVGLHSRYGEEAMSDKREDRQERSVRAWQRRRDDARSVRADGCVGCTRTGPQYAVGRQCAEWAGSSRYKDGRLSGNPRFSACRDNPLNSDHLLRRPRHCRLLLVQPIISDLNMADYG